MYIQNISTDNCLNEINFISKRNLIEIPCISIINETVKEISFIANKFSLFETIVFLGIGGSSLGGQVLNSLAKYQNKNKKIIFIEDIHPISFNRTINELNKENTAVIAISKSGSTAETLCQLMTILNKWNDINKNQFLIITENKNSPIKNLANYFGFLTADFPENIGGRYSVFSIVGLLPAALAGLNIENILTGAKTILKNINSEQWAPAISAKSIFACKKPISVMMPYSDWLIPFSMWYRQLCAESLGKNNKGITPIVSQGTVDQHSQLQLYLDGPDDKFFTLLKINENNDEPALKNYSDIDKSLSYLSGHTMNELLNAEYKATVNSLINKKRPVRTITINKLNEESLGALLMHFIIEIILIADYMEINPFDQPAVEYGKILTRKYLEK